MMMRSSRKFLFRSLKTRIIVNSITAIILLLSIWILVAQPFPGSGVIFLAIGIFVVLPLLILGNFKGREAKEENHGNSGLSQSQTRP